MVILFVLQKAQQMKLDIKWRFHNTTDQAYFCGCWNKVFSSGCFLVLTSKEQWCQLWNYKTWHLFSIRLHSYWNHTLVFWKPSSISSLSIYPWHSQSIVDYISPDSWRYIHLFQCFLSTNQLFHTEHRMDGEETWIVWRFFWQMAIVNFLLFWVSKRSSLDMLLESCSD